MRALVIRHPFIDQILDGGKRWELRSSNTKVRERIGLIAGGSGTVIGVCDLVDSVPLTPAVLRANAPVAGICPDEARSSDYRHGFAWVMQKPKRLRKPVPYRHPSGAVIWVTLDRRVEDNIRRQYR